MNQSVRKKCVVGAVAGIVLLASTVAYNSYSQPQPNGFLDDSGHKIRHVLLISIDGMHAVDFLNCSTGGYCPNLAALAGTGVNYLNTSTSKPSDSFPGLMALVTGGSPRTYGAFYDVAYDRSLDPPALTTGNGVALRAAARPMALRRAPRPSSTRASISIRRSSTGERRPGSMAVSPPSITASWSAIPPRVARPSTRGTSSAPTRFSGSSMRPAVTRPGPTSTLRILRFPARATAPT